MPTHFEVTEPAALLPFLLAKMPERSRTAVKALLANRLVSVNNELVTHFNHPLTAGQQVAIHRAGEVQKGPGHGLRIVHQDAQVIVIEKPAGLLSMATGTGRDITAFSLLSGHVKKADSRNRIFIVHRLDRETSGLMMFARSQAVQEALQDDWQAAVLERTYVAVVEGRVTKPEGCITSWLKEDQALIMRSSATPNDGQKATTHFRVLQSSARYSLLELSLETGRKNQIRVHLQDLGHSVIGDSKYGAAQNPLHRLGLHARVLSFRHPVSGAVLRFETPIPPEFLRLLPPARAAGGVS
jgi:23S rRNA pseudouridine1911/1915/1917 synthase